MMLFLRKYGFLFIPPVYWLIYLGARLTYNGLAGEFSPDLTLSVITGFFTATVIFYMFYVVIYSFERMGAGE